MTLINGKHRPYCIRNVCIFLLPSGVSVCLGVNTRSRVSASYQCFGLGYETFDCVFATQKPNKTNVSLLTTRGCRVFKYTFPMFKALYFATSTHIKGILSLLNVALKTLTQKWLTNIFCLIKLKL